MTVKNIYLAATGMTGLREITHQESYGQATASAEIVCTGHSLAIGDLCTVDLGYDTNHQAVITNGVVKSITARKPEFNYSIVVQDKLVRAVDDFLASDNPDSPFMATNISAEDLVVSLLAHAGITGVVTEATGFTFGTVTPIPINLMSVWDEIDNICRICGFACFAQPDGTVKFINRKPYIVGGDASEHTFTVGASGDILEISRMKSDEWLRNKVSVYGNTAAHITANASASSPYLPGGFFKTMVIGSELIDQQADAQRTADLNLTMFNRLTETVTLKALGLPSIHIRDIVDVTEPFCGLSAGDLWFVHAVTHSISNSGYSMALTLTK